jgi:hypothetical protein
MSALAIYHQLALECNASDLYFDLAAYRRETYITEPQLLNQFQTQPHTTREVPFSAADHHCVAGLWLFAISKLPSFVRGRSSACLAREP